MIVVFGSINVDLVTRVERAPAPGETVRGSDYALIPGGKGANQALAARRAGAAVRLYGAIGYDGFADIALMELAPAGVDLTGVARKPHTTGLAIITVDAKGENSIVLAPGANAHPSAASIPPDVLGPRDTLLLQMEVPFAESLAAAKVARAAGSRIVLSLAPYTPLAAEDIAAFDIIVVNEHEAADLARHLGVAAKGADATATALARRLGRTVITTLGADGAVAVHDGALVRVPALPVTPVDTTGAGDTFCGVLAAALDEGADMRTAMARAAVAGSLATTTAGAQPSFPTRAEIDAASA
ncbi:MAG TPA: ribokinase [Bauldia sp.]|nr:ribokinase [Bauldia sp.]